jgi:hypothetical protein
MNSRTCCGLSLLSTPPELSPSSLFRSGRLGKRRRMRQLSVGHGKKLAFFLHQRVTDVTAYDPYIEKPGHRGGDRVTWLMGSRVEDLRWMGGRIDFPINDLLDNDASLASLEKHLHREGQRCPRCGATERRPVSLLAEVRHTTRL